MFEANTAKLELILRFTLRQALVRCLGHLAYWQLVPLSGSVPVPTDLVQLVQCANQYIGDVLQLIHSFCQQFVVICCHRFFTTLNPSFSTFLQLYNGDNFVERNWTNNAVTEKKRFLKLFFFCQMKRFRSNILQ